MRAVIHGILFQGTLAGGYSLGRNVVEAMETLRRNLVFRSGGWLEINQSRSA